MAYQSLFARYALQHRNDIQFYSLLLHLVEDEVNFFDRRLEGRIFSVENWTSVRP